MPNRILRDWTDSFTIDELDVHSERFFVRLIMKVDDYGRFHADARLLKSSLFPLKSDVRDTDISRWLAACEKAGLITTYNIANKSYLQIDNFKQVLRQKHEKFPSPLQKTSSANQMHSTCVASASLKRNETETETEDEEEQPSAKIKSFKSWDRVEFHELLKPFVETYGKTLITNFFSYWSETNGNGKMRLQLEKTWEIKRRLQTWKANESKFGNNQTPKQPEKVYYGPY